jgi:hypothetical protein
VFPDRACSCACTLNIVNAIRKGIKITEYEFDEDLYPSQHAEHPPLQNDVYWEKLLIESAKQCHRCDTCTPIGKRGKRNGIHDGRFDTKEMCCNTRVSETGCPVSVRIKELRKQTEHDEQIRRDATEKLLDEIELFLQRMPEPPFEAIYLWNSMFKKVKELRHKEQPSEQEKVKP